MCVQDLINYLGQIEMLDLEGSIKPEKMLTTIFIENKDQLVANFIIISCFLSF